jgi:transglutaminase/protease-like cytokinesis protein 3
MDNRTPHSSRIAKVRWLRSHEWLWKNFSADDRQVWSDIIKEMKAEGLIAQTTYAFDVNLASLISEAQKV